MVRRFWQEVIELIQVRNDGENRKSGESWLNFGYNLKVNLIRVIDGFDT